MDSKVRVTGFVDDPEEYYKRATVFVAPILVGGGIIVKILDALAAGTPVVTTGFGNEGIGGVPGRDLLVADEANLFADNVIAIMKDPEMAGRLSTNGRTYVFENYSLDATMEKIEAVYEKLVPRIQ
jgi:glycosyltransferase involved in cell wall biosynthesis